MRPSGAAPPNSYGYSPQPSAPTETNSNTGFGSIHSSVSTVPYSYPPTGSHVPSLNVNSTSHTHYETSTRPSEPVDDFASGFGRGTSYGGGHPQYRNAVPSQGSQGQSNHHMSHYGDSSTPTTHSEPVDDFSSGFGKGSYNRNVQNNAVESQAYSGPSSSFENSTKNHGMKSALPSITPQTRHESVDDFASGFGEQTVTREVGDHGAKTKDGMIRPVLF